MQWAIMRAAFAAGDGTLVLIGDPKQAIYAFRGADVYAYLDAARAATTQATLQVNWRSDEGLLRAYDTMFGGAKLGDEGIVYRTVEAAPPNKEPRLTGAPVSEPLRVRFLRRDDVTMTRQGYASNAPAREHIAKDLAADLVRLLNSGAEIERRNEDGTRHSRVTVCPGHIAVLVRTHRNAALIRDELDAVGVPAVINGAGSVFGTLAARDWMRLLAAIERPADPRRAHTAALTPFLGWTAEQVAAADDDAWEDVHQRLHHWARVLREKGVAALMETIALVEGLPGRVLADTSGERRLTDLRHVGAAAARRGQDRADGHGRAGHLAARADRLGRAGGRRGAQPPAGVRRRGRAGADDPPQQGPRVPDRLLPVPVGAGLHPAQRPGRLPRHGGRQRAARGRRAQRLHLRQAPQAVHLRAARRGPAAGLRGAHPRAAPGDRVVGGLVRLAALLARAAAVRARPRRHDRHRRVGHAAWTTTRSARSCGCRRTPAARSRSSAPRSRRRSTG